MRPGIEAAFNIATYMLASGFGGIQRMDASDISGVECERLR